MFPLRDSSCLHISFRYFSEGKDEQGSDLPDHCQKMRLPQSHTALEVLRDCAGGRGQDTHPGPRRLSTLSIPPEDMLGLGFS